MSYELPSAARSLGRSLRLGYSAGRLAVVVAFVTTVAAAVPDALFALAFAWLADAVIGRDGTQILLVAIVLAVLTAASWLLNLVSGRANQRFADRVAVPIESHVARLQASAATLIHHERPDYLDRLSVLREHAPALSALYQQLFSLVGAIIRLGITLVLLMSVHPALGLLGLLAIPGVLVSTWRGGIVRTVEEAGARHDRLARHLFLVGTTPAPGKELRVSGMQRRVRDEWNSAWRRRYAPLARARWASTMWQAATFALFGVGLIVGVLLVAPQGSGAVLLVLMAGSRLSQYVDQTAGQMHFFRTIWLDVSRRTAWLEDLVSAAATAKDLPAPDRLRTGIQLRNVSFRYPLTDRDVLEGITLNLPAGSVVAVVGENGAGKSTLVKLLCGFYEPTAGQIRIDDADLARISIRDWRARLSAAFQDFFRFEFTAQIAVGVGDLNNVDNRAAVEAAVDRANANDVVAKLRHGLETQLGSGWEDGAELSHGQWQKLALARSSMRRSPLLLVLDEPTSALDAETEHAVFEHFARVSRTIGSDNGQITVLVSHRFSTVQMADLIVVLDGSRLVDVGSHGELMARDGLYAELYRIQAAAYR